MGNLTRKAGRVIVFAGRAYLWMIAAMFILMLVLVVGQGLVAFLGIPLIIVAFVVGTTIAKGAPRDKRITEGITAVFLLAFVVMLYQDCGPQSSPH